MKQTFSLRRKPESLTPTTRGLCGSIAVVETTVTHWFKTLTLLLVMGLSVNLMAETAILDGSVLTTTATTNVSTITQDEISYSIDAGVKYQTSNQATNKLGSEKSIFFPNGKSLHNTVAFGSALTELEVYSNYGASTSSAVSIAFSSSEITSEPSDFDVVLSLNTANKVYDAGKIPTGTKYIYVKNTSNKNAQIQLKATYTASSTSTINKTANLSNFTYEEGQGPSAAQSFKVSGSNLTANITVTAPTNFEVSTTSGSGYAGSVTLTQSSGSVAETTIYVRMKSGLSQGTGKGGNISLTSTGATTQTIAVTGSVTAAAVHRTVTWYVNNVVYTIGNPTIDVVDGQKVTTLPTEPTSQDVSSTTFMGWTNSPINTKQANEPTLLFKTATAAPAISGADASYYAVFAKESSKEEPITATFNATGLSTGTYKTGTKNDDKGYQWSYYAAVTNQSGTLYYSLNSNASNYNIGSPKYEGNITAISLKAYNGSSSEARKLLLCSNNLTAQPSEGDLAEVTINKSESFSTTYNFNLSGAGSFSQFYIYAAKALGVSEVKVTYSPISYSDYTTKFTLPTYSITFDDNGATSGEMSAIENIAKGGSQTLPQNQFEKIGYSFTGWKDQDDNEVTDKATIDNITKNITLTAQWEAKTIYVTLDKNGSEEDGIVTVVYDATSIEEIVHVADWAAHELQGYFTESTGGSKVLNADGTFAGNVAGWIVDGKWAQAEDATLYAQWLAQQKCTMTDIELEGCIAAQGNVTEVDVNAEGVTLNYILADNHTWDGTETYITMGTADLEEGIDYTFEEGVVAFLTPITGNINVMISCPWSSATLTLSAIEHKYSFGEGLKVNDEITLPNTVNYQASGKTFVGWSSETILTEGSMPTTKYWAKGANYTIQSATDKLYAVYATENKGAESWVIATSIDVLHDGDKVAFTSAKAEQNYASAGRSYNNEFLNCFLDPIAITLENNVVTSGAENIVPITLGGNATDGWTMYMDDYGYIVGTYALNKDGNRQSNTILFSNTPKNLQSLTINTSTYEATVKVSGDSTMRYNSGSPRFSIYKSGQTAIKLLKQNVEPSTFNNYTTSGFIHVDAPTFDELTKPGTFTDAEHLVIINVPTSATVRYTLDGTEPTEASATYDENEGITLTATATIKAKAFIEGTPSEPLEGKFTIHNYNTVAALINGAEHNKAAVLNLNEVYVLGVYSLGKQIFIQEGTKGTILTLTDAIPEEIKAGVKLTANVSGTYIFTAHNRPQMNACTLSNMSVSGENQRPADIPVLSAIDETTATDNLLTLVQINNVYSVSKSNNDIVMNSASDETGTSYNVNNLLGAVKNTLPDKELACNVIGIFYKKIVNNNVEEYSIVPVLESDFATASPQLTILPTLDVYGGAEDSPLAVAPNKQLTFTRVEFELESSKYKSYYQIGTSAPVEVTAKTTTITLEGNNEDIVKLKIYSTRPYYTTNEAEYFYKIDESKIEYEITYSGVQSYVGVSGAKSACAGAIVELTGTRKVEHYYPGDVTVTKTGDESVTIDVTRTELSATEATYSFKMPAYHVTVKIGYTKDPTYAVNYNKGGQNVSGDVPAQKSYYKDDEVTIVDNPFTRTNYAFTGWEVKYNNGSEDVLITPENNKFKMPSFPVVITPIWEKTYEVIYDKGAATSATGSVTEEPQIEGAVITLKANAFKATGYSFTGWKASTDEQIYQPDAEFTMPAQAVTFTAQWDEAEYKKDGTWELVTSADQLEIGKFYVIGNSQYGKTMTSTLAGSTNKRLTAIETVYSDDKVEGDKGIIMKSDLPEETVIFQLGKESEAWTFMNVATEQYYHTGDHSNPEWLTTENKALWSLTYNSTTLTMKAIHGSYTSDSTLQYYHDANSASNCGFRPYTSSQKAIRLYRFYPTARKVYFSANAGEDAVTNMPDRQRADHTTNEVTIPNVTPERTGYTFTKWNSATTGQGTHSAQPNETIKLWQAECTLHAIWTKNTPLLTVANVEHGTIQAKPNSMADIYENGSANVEYQKSVVISHTDDDEEYAFKTWKITKTGDESVVITPTVGKTSVTFDMPDYPVTISAIYESKTTIKYTLMYDANGGEGTMTGNPFTQHWNDYITVSNNKDGDNDIFTKTLCTFDGWNTKADGTGASYAAGAHFYMKSDVTLYAQWKGSGATYRLDKNYDGNIYVNIGAAPQGSTATYNNTNPSSAVDQATEGNTITITLTGYAGKVIKNITANIKANGSESGKLNITIGDKNVFDKTYVDLEADNISTYQTRNFGGYGFKPIFVGEKENIVIVVTSPTHKSAYIQNITVEYETPQTTTIRGNLTPDQYTTYCEPQTVLAGTYEGATFWNIADKSYMSDGIRLYSITIEQHLGDLEAGVPYIMLPEATELTGVKYGDVVEEPVAEGNNGLIGVFVNTPFDNLSGDEAAIEAAAVERGIYVISNGTLYLCGNNCGVYANRAYIQRDQINYVAPTGAPRRTIGGGHSTPTGLLENILGTDIDNTVRKMIINEKMYILRAGRIYNAAGTLVK